MSFEKLAEKKIADAIRNGEFDKLPGSGQPIDLEDYFKTPEDRRMAYGLLKSANLVPEEVDLLAEIARLEEQAVAEPALEARKALRREAESLRLKLAVRRG
jgi:hypothetical protein